MAYVVRARTRHLDKTMRSAILDKVRDSLAARGGSPLRKETRHRHPPEVTLAGMLSGQMRGRH